MDGTSLIALLLLAAFAIAYKLTVDPEAGDFRRDFNRHQQKKPIFLLTEKPKRIKIARIP